MDLINKLRTRLQNALGRQKLSERFTMATLQEKFIGRGTNFRYTETFRTYF